MAVMKSRALLMLASAVLVILSACTSQADRIDASLEPRVLEWLAENSYDEKLCTLAQAIMVNAEAGAYETLTLVAEGGTFITEQMNTDGDTNTVTVAALLETVDTRAGELAVDMACKMVDQDRVNAVLGLGLTGPRGSCREVNEFTYAVALSQLSPKEREHYRSAGAQLEFIDDYDAGVGGAWLASTVSDYITPIGDSAKPAALRIQAPAVRVPWPEAGGDWFQGTNHCKVITFAAMTRWMRTVAFESATELFPRPKPKCVEPDSRTSEVGSCVQYFGPAGAQFCQDYSGSGWTAETAQADCAIRHSSLDVWNAKAESYDGGGGIYSASSCKDRDAVAEATREPVNRPDSAYIATCVFRCNTADEALWHQLSPMAGASAGRTLDGTCDLALKIDW